MRILRRALCLLALSALARPALADEIQLKDGKTFYGTIVGYDNKMFKVKTDFGFIYVEKEKIAAIIPNKTEGVPPVAANAGAAAPAPAQRTSQPDSAQPVRANVTQPTAEPAVETIAVPPAPRISTAPVRPQLPANSPKLKVIAPSIKSVPDGAASSLSNTPAASLAPAISETPVIPEEVQGNTYTNHVHGFRMYKAPSWQLIDNATELPNAIVAMGTQNESTLLVVGREKTKQQLDSAANTVEKRLSDVYTDYQKISQRRTRVGGLPAIDNSYRGKAEEHD